MMEVRKIEAMRWPPYVAEVMVNRHTVSLDLEKWLVCVDVDAMKFYSQEAREFAQALLAAADAVDSAMLDRTA